jgi:hypothetical protein
MDILITKYDFRTLMDVIIVDPTCINMVQRTSTIITHLAMMATKKKTRSYAKRALGDDFIPLVIETYVCFHYRFDSFLTTCAHTIIACHQWSFLIPSMFVSHYRQHVSIVLQHAQAIAKRVATLGSGSSSLPHITTNAPLSLANLW